MEWIEAADTRRGCSRRGGHVWGGRAAGKARQRMRRRGERWRLIEGDESRTKWMRRGGLGTRSKHVARLFRPLWSSCSSGTIDPHLLLDTHRCGVVVVYPVFIARLLRCAENTTPPLPSIMRWCLSFFLFCFLAVVHALSSSGNRLLVVLEDAAEKDLYSTFWGDLEGRSLGWILQGHLC